MSEIIKKIFILTENYHGVYSSALEGLSGKHEALTYNELSDKLFSMNFYYGKSYERAFSDSNIEVQQIIPECSQLQKRWASERGVYYKLVLKEKFNKLAEKLFKEEKTNLKESIVWEQIKLFKPDIVWVFSGISISSEFIKKIKTIAKKVVLWWSCPISKKNPYENYDLIFSCIPELVDYFREQGIRSAYMAHAFDPNILDQISPVPEKEKKAIFCGSFNSKPHQARADFLDYLSQHIKPFEIYGYAGKFLEKESPPRPVCHEPLWGNKLYELYGSALIVVHKNIETAGAQASAKRLFEAGGMGACLVIEKSDDLKNIFPAGDEVVTYSSKEECAEKINWLLAHSEEAIAIGRRAQDVILKNHTYKQRVNQFIEILSSQTESV